MHRNKSSESFFRKVLQNGSYASTTSIKSWNYIPSRSSYFIVPLHASKEVLEYEAY